MTIMYSRPLNNRGLRGDHPHAVKNLNITYSWPFVSRVSAHPWIQSVAECVVLQYLLLKEIHVQADPCSSKVNCIMLPPIAHVEDLSLIF